MSNPFKIHFCSYFSKPEEGDTGCHFKGVEGLGRLLSPGKTTSRFPMQPRGRERLDYESLFNQS